jgi:hypothetical protein
MSKEVLPKNLLADANFYGLKRLVVLLETHQNSLIASPVTVPVDIDVDTAWFSDSDPNIKWRIKTVRLYSCTKSTAPMADQVP